MLSAFPFCIVLQQCPEDPAKEQPVCLSSTCAADEPGSPIRLCSAMGQGCIGWKYLILSRTAQIHQHRNSSRRADPRLSSTKYLGPKLPIISYNASSFQSMDRASSLCSYVVGYLHEVPGRWLWYTFWVFMRPISFLLHGERVHQMVQRCSNFKRFDKEQVLSTHYILNFIFY